MEDLYKTLGVEKTATKDEIKKAYRNLAFKYHPDRNNGDKACEEKFKEINNAYQILGDDEKRRQYDSYGFNPNSSQQSSYYQSSTGTYGSSYDPFEEFFRNAYSSGNSNQYTYTYTTRQTENPKGRGAVPYLKDSIIQILLSLFGMSTIGQLSLIIWIICLVCFIKGIKGAYRSLKWMLTK